MSTEKKTVRATIVCSGNRQTAFIRIGDCSLEAVGSKEELIAQWSQLRCGGRLSEGQSRWLLPAILTCKLRYMTKRAAADDRLYSKQIRKVRRQRLPLDTMGGVGLPRFSGVRV